MSAAIVREVSAIEPVDETERVHLSETLAWMASGVGIYRLQKPATPPKHLVAYFPVLDDGHILLVDHRNAGLWLPNGGHVEPGEHPRDTVRRELREELGIDLAGRPIGPPLLLTVTQTVGATADHTDVSLWYPITVPRSVGLVCDQAEFAAARWFAFPDVPWTLTDPHLQRFVEKWHLYVGRH